MSKNYTATVGVDDWTRDGMVPAPPRGAVFDGTMEIAAGGYAWADGWTEPPLQYHPAGQPRSPASGRWPRDRVLVARRPSPTGIPQRTVDLLADGELHVRLATLGLDE